MDYPNNFDTPPFPESRKIALSRFVAVWYLILFFVIASMCGLVIWTAQNVRIAPYLISIDNITGEWRIEGQRTKETKRAPVDTVMQESVAFNFARAWFEISDNAEMNAANWCDCMPARCAYHNDSDDWTPCVLCCSADIRLYESFLADTVPSHAARARRGETWNLRADSFSISPMPGVSATGGLWRATATLESNMARPRQLEIYIVVGRNRNVYPLSLGYHVIDFNWFVME